jgi:ubiquinol-cytochrome c reductase iron-sulfur subunit
VPLRARPGRPAPRKRGESRLRALSGEKARAAARCRRAIGGGALSFVLLAPGDRLCLSTPADRTTGQDENQRSTPARAGVPTDAAPSPREEERERVATPATPPPRPPPLVPPTLPLSFFSTSPAPSIPSSLPFPRSLTLHPLSPPPPSYDSHSHEQFAPGGDQTKRAFTYFVLTGGRFVYASAIRLAVLKLVLSMTATKDVLAMASLEVDLAKVGAGQTVTVKWRGKPVFVRRRTEVEIAEAREVPMSALRDPQPDDVRVINPEWLVVVGVCTHLGCVPLPGAGDYNGWFCPCHGSHYDTSGRIRKGPAPTNLEVPEYKFIKDDGTLLIG